jgi:hypothetical protein
MRSLECESSRGDAKKEKCRYSIFEETIETATNIRFTGEGNSGERRGKG